MYLKILVTLVSTLALFVHQTNLCFSDLSCLHLQSLTEDQMMNLLMECEMALSRNYDSGTEGFTDINPYGFTDINPVGRLMSPNLSNSALSELLQEACQSPTSPGTELRTHQEVQS